MSNIKREELNALGEDVFNNREKYTDVKYPVYVLSKGRAGSACSMDRFEEDGLNPTVFVEAEEEDAYREHYKNVVVIPKSGQGVTYVRNYIKQYSIEQGDAWHWQVDDNILDFRIRLDNKNVKNTARNNLAMAEYITDQYENVGIAGLTHTAFAFAKEHHVSINRQVYSCVLVDNSIPIKWTPDLPEDTDYSLQILTRGLCTLSFDKILMGKEVTKEGNGGNDNSHEWRLARAKKLQETWPQANFKYIQQYGRVKILPSRIWRQFTQVPMKRGEQNFFEQFLSG